MNDFTMIPNKNKIIHFSSCVDLSAWTPEILWMKLIDLCGCLSVWSDLDDVDDGAVLWRVSLLQPVLVSYPIFVCYLHKFDMYLSPSSRANKTRQVKCELLLELRH